jgi:hypothetical protein
MPQVHEGCIVPAESPRSRRKTDLLDVSARLRYQLRQKRDRGIATLKDAAAVSRRKNAAREAGQRTWHEPWSALRGKREPATLAPAL